MDADTLRAWVIDAGQRARALVADLSAEQLTGPYLPIVNPLRWEVAHAAYFYSYWVLRHGRGAPPVRADEDALFDSIKIGHSLRWKLPLPDVAGTLAYVDEVHRRVIDGLAGRAPGEREAYLTAWGVFHEDMHGEAFA
ncbi:MAG TPA: DinB family protein, partial [Kofleriaceae bacterium]|nr:DinB family protein [Kofleriaceae bacterium]